MELINIEEQDLLNRIEELEKRKKMDGIVMIVGLVSTVLTILLNIPNVIEIYNNYFSFPNENELNLFIEGYSRAYSKVVNNYIQGNEDSTPLDEYISNNDSGKEFKNEIIANIKKNIEKGELKSNNIYEYTFNYRNYKSFEETGDSDCILVSGVSTIIRSLDKKDPKYEPNDGISRYYEVIIDKNKKDIKIEKRVYK